jgi:hypothetical protein
MRQAKTTEERTIYRGHGVVIRRDPQNWIVGNIGTAKKGARAGEETEGLATYHPSLASACEEAAYRIADASEPFTLRNYARELRAAVGELREISSAGV